MKATLRILGALCVVQAVGGTADGLWGGGHGWFQLNLPAFLEGRQIFAGIVLGVLGVALWGASGAVRRK
ncbi:hypothetical protein [Streptosporangium sp. NPDC051022]|uniref:hypothetical protein n=1 Tax=Streptosporangium sp. NPDC051022 TaxID=3155752 RepID=UPI0034133838